MTSGDDVVSHYTEREAKLILSPENLSCNDIKDASFWKNDALKKKRKRNEEKQSCFLNVPERALITSERWGFLFLVQKYRLRNVGTSANSLRNILCFIKGSLKKSPGASCRSWIVYKPLVKFYGSHPSALNAVRSHLVVSFVKTGKHLPYPKSPPTKQAPRVETKYHVFVSRNVSSSPSFPLWLWLHKIFSCALAESTVWV